MAQLYIFFRSGAALHAIFVYFGMIGAIFHTSNVIRILILIKSRTRVGFPKGFSNFNTTYSHTIMGIRGTSEIACQVSYHLRMGDESIGNYARYIRALLAARAATGTITL